MIGTFTRRLAVETPDGVSAEFSAPEEWSGTMYVALNGVVQNRGCVLTSITTFEGEFNPELPNNGITVVVTNIGVAFFAAPHVGDVVEFLYAPASSDA